MTISVKDVTVGESRTEVLFDDLSRTQMVLYSGASGDYNPLHSDATYAQEIAGYPGVFAHGMLTMGASGKVLTDWFGADALKNFGVRFVNQVWPGDALTTTVTVEALRDENGQNLVDLKVLTVNQDDKPVVTGTAVAMVNA